MPNKPIVGITMGDAAGIGPEIILKAVDNNEARIAANYLVYGSPQVMKRACSPEMEGLCD